MFNMQGYSNCTLLPDVHLYPFGVFTWVLIGAYLCTLVKPTVFCKKLKLREILSVGASMGYNNHICGCVGSEHIF